MFRLNKLTDYGIVLLTHFARQGGGTNARELAAAVGLPLPTVGKLLKTLTHAGLLVSQRGKSGGYALARPPAEVTIASIVAALEGPISITECNLPGMCEHERGCGVRMNWQAINRAVHDALSRLTLADMSRPLLPTRIGLERSTRLPEAPRPLQRSVPT